MKGKTFIAFLLAFSIITNNVQSKRLEKIKTEGKKTRVTSSSTCSGGKQCIFKNDINSWCI